MTTSTMRLTGIVLAALLAAGRLDAQSNEERLARELAIAKARIVELEAQLSGKRDPKWISFAKVAAPAAFGAAFGYTLRQPEQCPVLPPPKPSLHDYGKHKGHGKK